MKTAFLQPYSGAAEFCFLPLFCVCFRCWSHRQPSDRPGGAEQRRHLCFRTNNKLSNLKHFFLTNGCGVYYINSHPGATFRFYTQMGLGDRFCLCTVASREHSICRLASPCLSMRQAEQPVATVAAPVALILAILSSLILLARS